MIGIDIEKESGIKILVDSNSYEVTVCDMSNTYSNGYAAAVSNKTLYAMINGKFRQIIMTDDTITWLKSHEKVVESIVLERIEHNVKYQMPSSKLSSDEKAEVVNEIKCIENMLKDNGWTNKKFNKLFDNASNLSNEQ